MSEDRAVATSSQSAGSQPPKCCILCGDKGTQLSNYRSWGAIERKFLYEHLGRYPPEESYMCKKHLLEAQRHHTNTQYTPKWKKVSTAKSTNACIHPECCNKFHEKLIKPAFATITELERLLGIESSADNPFLLCPTCYMKLYRQFNPVPNCASCGATPKYGKFCRYSPNPTIVSQYIKDTTGTDVAISPDDWICTNCYNTHCSIIKSIECNQTGSNEMLTKAIEIWEATTNAHNTDKLTKAVLSSVIFVAKYLLVQKAVLLPWACHVFLQAYGVQYIDDIKSVQVNLEMAECNVQFSSRWLLHQLISFCRAT